MATEERDLRALADQASEIGNWPEWPEVGEWQNPFMATAAVDQIEMPDKMPEMAVDGQQTEWPASMPGFQGQDVDWPASMPGLMNEGDSEFPGPVSQTTSEQVFPQTAGPTPEAMDFPASMPGLPEQYADVFPSVEARDAEAGSTFPDFAAHTNADGGTTVDFSPPQEQQAAQALGWPGAISSPKQSGTDPSLYVLLQQIANGISTLTGAKSPENEGSQQYQFPWSQQGFQDLESMENYAAASPAMNMTTLNGVRGAGGWGYGSKFGQSPFDLFEPANRVQGVS